MNYKKNLRLTCFVFQLSILPIARMFNSSSKIPPQKDSQVHTHREAQICIND